MLGQLTSALKESKKRIAALEGMNIMFNCCFYSSYLNCLVLHMPEIWSVFFCSLN